ncbi:lectin MOA-related protein [Thermoproteota archaeon]
MRKKTEDNVPYDMLKMSELPEKKEEETKVVIMDKKIRRRIRVGEEEKLDTIGETEGVLEYTEQPEDVPGAGGETTISGQTITGSTLSNAIVRDFGSVCSGGKVYLSDGFYFLYSDSAVKKVIQEDLTDLQMWINTYFDCDDFSQVVAGFMNDKLKGVPFGVLWFKGKNYYHAVNCYYSQEQKKMKVVEPQNNAVYDFNKSKYCPMLVVI